MARAPGFEGQLLWDSSKPDGTPKKQLDVSRLAAMGWQAKISLDQGLASTVSLFREELQTRRARL